MGQGVTKFRLRDWGLSRQRYWGCPIPVVHCDACGVVPEQKENLPVGLPDDVTFDKPGNPLDRHPTWRDVPCPPCGKPARRETDTMDTFVDSSWYFARFTAPHAATPTDGRGRRLLDERRPVHRRHRARDPAPALLPLLRPRDAHLRPPARVGDRAVRRAVHARHGDARDLPDARREGTARSITCPKRSRSRTASAARGRDGRGRSRSSPRPRCRNRRRTSSTRWRSSRRYGADTARWFVLSDSPPERDVEWTAAGAEAANRHLARVWRMAAEIGEAPGQAEADERPAARDAQDDPRRDRAASKASASTPPSPSSTPSPTPSSGRRPGPPRRARGDADPGAADVAHDPAPGRGGLGDARAARA